MLLSQLPPNLASIKYTWCLTSTETIRLIRDGENGGEGGMEVEEREIMHL